MSLADAKLQTLVWSSDVARSEEFYSDVLGLVLEGHSHGALVYRFGQGRLRVSPVPSTTPSEHTVFGLELADIEPTIAELAAKGVEFARFAGFDYDAAGIWTAPDGTRVAWFRDPDGNLISLVQYGR